MTQPPPLRTALKRGAFVAAANWPLVAVQFIAEGTLKLLLGRAGRRRHLPRRAAARRRRRRVCCRRHSARSSRRCSAALRANPVALVAFGAAFLLVLLGGSALTFIVKGGTVAILAEAEAQAGPIERPPLRLDGAEARQPRSQIEPFLDGCRRLWRRYVRLGGCACSSCTWRRRAVYLGVRRWRVRARRKPRRAPRVDRSRRRWHRACSSCGSR